MLFHTSPEDSGVQSESRATALRPPQGQDVTPHSLFPRNAPGKSSIHGQGSILTSRIDYARCPSIWDSGDAGAHSEHTETVSVILYPVQKVLILTGIAAHIHCAFAMC